MGSFTESLRLAWDMATRWDPALWQVVGLSLQVSGSATLIGAAMGLMGGAWLAVARFPGQRAVVVALNTLLALPSVVVGLVVYLMLSRTGPLGAWGVLFTPTAMVLAQTVLVVPVVTALTRQLVADAAHGNGEQLRSMGARPIGVAGLLLVHERWALLTVLLTAFGRAVSEVGAVMIVGGNIAGVTRVMTTTIALETSKGDLPLALGLGIVLLSVVALINLGIALLQWLQRDQDAAADRRPGAATATGGVGS
ncbi:MAG: ABC transporter permease subunit [Betaproteobacteria bacterium]|nr:ABC transporter permease subunit [Betaproteobacteria bacterium]NBT10648.1 ABC transporter permease subunit [Betaproteobacteria bacterium]NBU48565.1 ABC transporter permease subunit [Betaproteobacteria bacterium]NBX96806.1 ABC transporter permease subunit [Betaproteobacteria bacterium]